MAHQGRLRGPAVVNPPLLSDMIRAARDASYEAVGEIYGTRSRRGQSYARWIVWRALRNRGLSFTDVARRTGGYDHTSVIYGVRKIEVMIATDSDIAAVAHKIARLFPARPVRESRPEGLAGTRFPILPGLEDCPLQ